MYIRPLGSKVTLLILDIRRELNGHLVVMVDPLHIRKLHKEI